MIPFTHLLTEPQDSGSLVLEVDWGTSLDAEIYASGKLSFKPYAARQTIQGCVIAVMEGRLEERGLQLIAPFSRVLRRGEIHEVILTDEEGAGPGRRVDRISYVCFFEVLRGGVVFIGDTFSVESKLIGRVVGFDETHAPNHLNIVLHSPGRISGAEAGLRLGHSVILEGSP